MSKIVRSALIAGLLSSSSMAVAGGLDRSGQSISPLFEEGRYAEFSLGAVMPSVDGTSAAILGSEPTGNVANAYFPLGAAFKGDINDRLSYALIFDQPFGASVSYDGTIAFDGTNATATSYALTALMRYKFNEGFSVYGGPVLQSISADVNLSGGAYGGLNGYDVSFDPSFGVGFAAGAAYERKDIALRVALTYRSEIKHESDTTQSVAPPSTTDITSPQSVNLDFQTGVAPKTLLFGSVRWVNWDGFAIRPTALMGNALVEYDSDTFTYALGLGRKFTEKWSGAVQVGYEAGTGGLSSTLGPTDGFLSLGVGATYTMDNMKITGGVRYVFAGDTDTGVGGTQVGSFRDNSAIAAGVKVGFYF
ncbi:OmpP1/FadL family transporter [Halovulum sp. GXIMD14793]